MTPHKVIGKPHSRLSYTVGFGQERDKEGRPVPVWTCGHDHIKVRDALTCKAEREKLRGYEGASDSPYYVIRNLTGHLLWRRGKRKRVNKRRLR